MAHQLSSAQQCSGDLAQQRSAVPCRAGRCCDIMCRAAYCCAVLSLSYMPAGIIPSIIPGTGTPRLYVLRCGITKNALSAQLSDGLAAQRSAVRCCAVPCPALRCGAAPCYGALRCAFFGAYSIRYLRRIRYQVPVCTCVLVFLPS